jgi:hypothetical protein
LLAGRGQSDRAVHRELREAVHASDNFDSVLGGNIGPSQLDVGDVDVAGRTQDAAIVDREPIPKIGQLQIDRIFIVQ